MTKIIKNIRIYFNKILNVLTPQFLLGIKKTAFLKKFNQEVTEYLGFRQKHVFSAGRVYQKSHFRKH